MRCREQINTAILDIFDPFYGIFYKDCQRRELLSAHPNYICGFHYDREKVLCNKDPLTLKSGNYMAELFPNSK